MKTERVSRDLRPLLAHVRPHRGRLVVALVLGLGFSAGSLAIPLVVRTVLDELTASGDARSGPPDISMWVLVLVGLIVVSGALGFAQWLVLGRLAERVVFDARSSLVRRLLSAAVPELARRSTGELVTRVTSDTLLLREAAAMSIVMVVNGAVALAGALALMASLDIVLFATMIGAVVVIGGAVALLLPFLGREQARSQAAVGALGGLLSGVLGAVRTVKASGTEERESARILAFARTSMVHRVRAVRGEALAMTCAGVGIQVAVVAVLALGGWRAGAGLLTIPTLVAFLLYAFQIAEPATSLAMHVGRLQTGIAAAARIADVHRLPTEIVGFAPDATSAPSPAIRAASDPILRFDGVVAGYGGAPVLRGVDLVIPRRGHVAVVGPSGAGKSTAFGVLMRFIEPSAGSVSLDGRDLSSLSIRAVRQQIAYVEQSAPWIPGSLRENVRYRHPDADDAEVRRALDAVGLLDIADALPHGLDTDVDGDEFSGGERARVAFARAILRPPAIILLDEATAQLDGISEASVRRLVADLARVSVVVTIAHRLSTVIDADRIYVFDGGRTRASGTHVELLESDEMYRRLVSGLRMTPLAS